MFLLNDPYHGNNHLPDLTVLLRVFVGERLTFPAVVIPSKKEQRLTRCGPAEGVSMTCSHGRPKSKFLSASLTGARRLMTGARNGPHLHHSGRFHIAQVPGVP